MPWNAWLHAGEHWHLALLPRLSTFAGTELGAGIFMLTLAPQGCRCTTPRTPASLNARSSAVHEIFRSMRDAGGMHYCAILLLGILLVLIAILVVLA